MDGVIDAFGSFDRQRESILASWREFLSIPSISASLAHHADCVRCADWLAARMRDVGIAAECIATGGLPIVYGEYKGQAGLPTVLFYGHYDVQPPDPLEEWTSPPFEPVLRNGRMFARGAQDNKGQVHAALEAIFAQLRAGALRCPMKFVIEGEEESGSRGITRFVEQHARRLRADVLFLSDTNMHAPGVPAVVMGLRGVASMTVRIATASHDLHSGLHGGVAPNAAAEAARLAAALHAPDGTVAVPGFAAGALKPTQAEQTAAGADAPDTQTYLGQIGAEGTIGNARIPIPERLGFHPCIDVNGIHAGYGGTGSKTVIPAQALLKISARLVPGQSAAAALDAIVDHLHRVAGGRCRITVEERCDTGGALRLPLDTPIAGTARRVLTAVCGREPRMLWEGASIPIVGRLAAAAEAAPLLVGFGLEEDRIHAPNESYSVEQLRYGYAFTWSLLAELGRPGAPSPA